MSNPPHGIEAPNPPCNLPYPRALGALGRAPRLSSARNQVEFNIEPQDTWRLPNSLSYPKI